MVKLIEQTDFYGVSGRIKFRGGPSRFSIINVMQWYEYHTHLIGEFFPNLTENKPEILGGELKMYDKKIKWFTPDGMLLNYNILCFTVLVCFGIHFYDVFQVGYRVMVFCRPTSVPLMESRKRSTSSVKPP